MEFFETIHVKTEKNIRINEIFNDITDILQKDGYQMIGNIGTTEVKYKKEKRRSDVAHEAWKEHCI